MNGLAILIPKKLTRTEVYISSIFVLLLQVIVDIIFDLEFNLYGYFKEGIDLVAFVTFLALYPAFSVCYLNYFPFNKPLVRKVVYILTISIFCIVYEYLSIKSGYFYHNKWNLWYSAVSYPALLGFMAWHLSTIRWIINKDYK